ncbi:hypothetical protein LSAT2_004855, partial [Lamellibrachia satsuma]
RKSPLSIERVTLLGSLLGTFPSKQSLLSSVQAAFRYGTQCHSYTSSPDLLLTST